jgi:anthranilate phosphoribosyltransferase
MTEPKKFSEVYTDLLEARLSPESVGQAFDAILAGAWTATQIAGFVTALRLSGETAAIIESAARAMRRVMVKVDHGFSRVVDTCGTGGDNLGTVNLSTGAAIIVAAAGLPVAKHGNRASSSQTGSADVLEALGIPIDLPPGVAGDVLTEAGITFLFAPAHHPSMRHAGQARRELGIRTIFNCLGPLANPAGATHQLLGAPDERLRPIIADVLCSLGSKRAWVVRGANGLDEMNPCGPTKVALVAEGVVSELEVEPGDFGLEPTPLDALRGGDASFNASVLTRVLSGEPHPSLNGFLLNAAAALVVADEMEPKAAARRAREIIASGAAKRTLDSWREVATKKKNSAQ